MNIDIKTFDDFIVGENNRTDYEACVAVAETLMLSLINNLRRLLGLSGEDRIT